MSSVTLMEDQEWSFTNILKEYFGSKAGDWCFRSEKESAGSEQLEYVSYEMK
jgi:hypothetical protein